jgi:hypothetical protein
MRTVRPPGVVGQPGPVLKATANRSLRNATGPGKANAWTGSSMQLRTRLRETRTGLGQAHGHIPEIGPSGLETRPPIGDPFQPVSNLRVRKGPRNLGLRALHGEVAGFRDWVAGAGGFEPPHGGIKISLIIQRFQPAFGKIGQKRALAISMAR